MTLVLDGTGGTEFETVDDSRVWQTKREQCRSKARRLGKILSTVGGGDEADKFHSGMKDSQTFIDSIDVVWNLLARW